jgi:hypothetical protein
MKSQKKILWLSLAENVAEAKYDDFIRYAVGRGISIQAIRENAPISPQKFSEIIDLAEAYMVTFGDVVPCEPFQRPLISAIKQGKRLALLGTSSEFNRFLLEFDLAITGERLCGPEALFDDERTILLRHLDQTNSTALSLFGGNDLTISSPSRVWYGNSANPLFKLPKDSRLLNKGDFFESPGPRELCCGGVWSDADTQAGVMVVAGSALSDPFQGVSGKFFPGIRANVGFAERLLAWLVGDLIVEQNAGASVEMLHSIEVGIYDLMVYILKKHFDKQPDDWWYYGIPESLRKIAAGLSEESKGSIPKEQGFYFLSYQTIIENNWKLFGPYFDPENRGKNKAMQWMFDLNELRNRLSHPLRLRESPLTPENQAFIQQRKHFIDSLSRVVITSKYCP